MCPSDTVVRNYNLIVKPLFSIQSLPHLFSPTEENKCVIILYKGILSQLYESSILEFCANFKFFVSLLNSFAFHSTITFTECYTKKMEAD